MTSTKLGRQVLGHRCTYSCDCDCEWIELDPEPLDSAHCPRTINPGSPSTFAAVMVVVAAGGLLTTGVAVVILNWLGVL